MLLSWNLAAIPRTMTKREWKECERWRRKAEKIMQAQYPRLVEETLHALSFGRSEVWFPDEPAPRSIGMINMDQP